MSEYQLSAFGEAAIFVALMILVSALYFFTSRNEPFSKRLLVSAYPLIFVLGELYALVASSYYERGSWESGSYIQTPISASLEYGLYGIYSLGLVMGIYASFKFLGPAFCKWLIILVLPIAALLLFISSMTLTRDWL